MTDFTEHLSPCFLPLMVVFLAINCLTFFCSKMRRTANSNHEKSFLGSSLLFVALFTAFMAIVSLTLPSVRRITPFPVEEKQLKSGILQHNPNEGHILITGASQGIGRAIAIELARRYAQKKSFILTSRTHDSLISVAQELESKYNANVTLVPNIDLSKADGAQQLYQATKEMGLYVDVLVLNAGVGSRGSHVTMGTDAIRHMIHLNIESTTILVSLYGNDMKNRIENFQNSNNTASTSKKIGARILIVSSILGAVPGAPTASMYAAGKAYLRSLAWGLAAEFQDLGIGVTCVLPGATSSTKFATRSNIENASVWHFPWTVSTADAVARRSVDGMIRGKIEVYPGGFLDLVFAKIFVLLAPPWLVTWFVGVSWNPWPYRFPPGWRKKGAEGEDLESLGRHPEL